MEVVFSFGGIANCVKVKYVHAFMFDGRYEIKAYLQKFIYGASENSRASMTIFSRLLARQRVPLIM